MGVKAADWPLPALLLALLLGRIGAGSGLRGGVGAAVARSNGGWPA